VTVEQGSSTLAHVKSSASLKELVDALNAIGVRPRDLIAIFQALRTAGALQARIEVQ
jgi:flagellar P-ring protein precursor FlgI